VGLADLTRRDAVERAIAEYDELGRQAFLDKYGFGEAQNYFLTVSGREYDSKAIVGAAHGFEHPTLGPLAAADFSGGEETVARKLRSLGFEVIGESGNRNPTWAFDELVLALDLYLRRGQVDSSDPEVVELSTFLRSLPIHPHRPNQESFRNPAGVSLKLANFAHLDPAYPGIGMRAGGARDGEVWTRFSGERDELSKVVALIRSGAHEGFPTDPEEDEDDVEEGRLLYRKHRARERNRKLVGRKKERVLRETGQLACETCGLVFGTKYGSLGDGYIECHHKVPLAESGETKTRLEDLAVLCSNCHRMVHRRQPWLSTDELRLIVVAARNAGSDPELTSSTPA
jgi:5-methylcytosine-specific restriction protein A